MFDPPRTNVPTPAFVGPPVAVADAMLPPIVNVPATVVIVVEPAVIVTAPVPRLRSRVPRNPKLLPRTWALLVATVRAEGNVVSSVRR